MKRFLLLILCLMVLAACSKDNEEANENPNEEVAEEQMEEEQEEEQEEEEQEEAVENGSDDGTIRNLSAMALVAEMGTGWNLGNSLDVEDRDKTFWGNPLPTEAMIDAIAARGFKTIRIPVTWSYHMGPAPDYTIESTYLDTVQQVVDWARENGMYVILNTHHEDPWIIPTYAQASEVSDRLAKVWTQIATRFQNYSDFLIFETLNEPRLRVVRKNGPEALQKVAMW